MYSSCLSQRNCLWRASWKIPIACLLENDCAYKLYSNEEFCKAGNKFWNEMNFSWMGSPCRYLSKYWYNMLIFAYEMLVMQGADTIRPYQYLVWTSIYRYLYKDNSTKLHNEKYRRKWLMRFRYLIFKRYFLTFKDLNILHQQKMVSTLFTWTPRPL